MLTFRRSPRFAASMSTENNNQTRVARLQYAVHVVNNTKNKRTTHVRLAIIISVHSSDSHWQTPDLSMILCDIFSNKTSQLLLGNTKSISVTLLPVETVTSPVENVTSVLSSA